MAINFPNSPAINDLYTFDGRTWIWNGYGWDAVAIGLPTTPGGSDTQIQYNNAGAFGGDEKFTYTTSTQVLSMNNGYPSYDDKVKLDGYVGNITCTGIVLAGQFSGSTSFLAIGASGSAPTAITIDGSNGSGMVLNIADAVFSNNGTGITIDDANKLLYLQSYGAVGIGDPNVYQNGTNLSVDDPNSRATFNKKFVVTDTGDYYAYDTGTSTYWKWASVNGVWTGTDTTSGSLP